MAWLEHYPRDYYKKYEKIDVKKRPQLVRSLPPAEKRICHMRTAALSGSQHLSDHR